MQIACHRRAVTLVVMASVECCSVAAATDAVGPFIASSYREQHKALTSDETASHVIEDAYSNYIVQRQGLAASFAVFLDWSAGPASVLERFDLYGDMASRDTQRMLRQSRVEADRLDTAYFGLVRATLPHATDAVDRSARTYRRDAYLAGVAPDLVNLVYKIVEDAPIPPSLAAVIQSYEVELDEVLVAHRNVKNSNRREVAVQDAASGRLEEMERYRLELATYEVRIRRVTVIHGVRMAHEIPPDLRSRWDESFQTSFYSDVFALATFRAIAEERAATADSDSRSAIDALIKTWVRESAPLLESAMRACDDRYSDAGVEERVRASIDALRGIENASSNVDRQYSSCLFEIRTLNSEFIRRLEAIQ